MRFSRFFAWLFMCWPLLLADLERGTTEAGQSTTH